MHLQRLVRFSFIPSVSKTPFIKGVLHSLKFFIITTYQLFYRGHTTRGRYLGEHCQGCNPLRKTFVNYCLPEVLGSPETLFQKSFGNLFKKNENKKPVQNPAPNRDYNPNRLHERAWKYDRGT